MAQVKVPYLKQRNGHWRWEPGPLLRARGAKGVTLRDPDSGRFLTEDEAIGAARKLNEAAASGLPATLPQSARTVKAIFDALRASKKFQADGDAKTKRLALASRRSYLSHMRFIEAWCGDIPANALTPDQVQNFYDDQCEVRGLHMGNAMMRTFSMAFNFAIKKLRWKIENPVTEVDITEADGRLVIWTLEEIETSVACADWMMDAWPDAAAVADAIVFGFTLGQRQADLLEAAPLVLVNGAYMFVQNKTHRRAFAPPTQPLTARIEKIAARWPNVTFTTALVNGRGHAWGANSSEFRYAFRGLRAVASGLAFAIDDVFDAIAGRPRRLRNLPFTPMPSLLGKKFQDLRDTAVTLLFAAGCSVGEIANITGHALKSVQDILDRHYFVRNAELAHSAGEKFRALLERRSSVGA